jgi:hypothetical protein
MGVRKTSSSCLYIDDVFTGMLRQKPCVPVIGYNLDVSAMNG